MPDAPTQTPVLLLHGLARSSRSMVPMARQLRRKGYLVHNLGYPSTRLPLEQLARDYLAPALEQCRRTGDGRVHVVAHSMGAILLRHQVLEGGDPGLGRVVMLGPPNRGSELIDRLGHLSLFRWINGPASLSLSTCPETGPAALGRVTFEAGVVAGTRSSNPWLSSFLEKENDGKVSVTRTHIEGINDHASIPCPHYRLMRDPEAIRLTLHFLAHGRFGFEDAANPVASSPSQAGSQEPATPLTSTQRRSG